MNLKKYWRVWSTSSRLSIQTMFEHRIAALMFMAGKFIRFFFFIIFIVILHGEVSQVEGYTLQQMITFFLIFNLFDLFGQVFFRGIYWFRQQIITGEFDYRLVKPLSSLFQALTRQTDILDIPLLIIVVMALIRQSAHFQPQQILFFIFVSIAAMVIITAIHIFVASLGIITTEVDHTIMIYRDISAMARFPIDIYTEAVRVLLTFVIPISLAYTVPARAFMGILSPFVALVSIIASAVILTLSIVFWRYALTQYSSASS